MLEGCTKKLGRRRSSKQLIALLVNGTSGSNQPFDVHRLNMLLSFSNSSRFTLKYRLSPAGIGKRGKVKGERGKGKGEREKGKGKREKGLRFTTKVSSFSRGEREVPTLLAHQKASNTRF